MTLGEYINRYLNEHDMSMRTFATLAGVSHTYISYIVNGKSSGGGAPVPTIDKYRNFARAMGMDVNDLIRAVDDQIAWGSGAVEEQAGQYTDGRNRLNTDGRGNRIRGTSDYWDIRNTKGARGIESGLTPEEQTIVYNYRDSAPAIQEAAARMLRESAERERKKKEQADAP